MARHRIISRLSLVFGMAGVAAASLSGCGGGGGSSSNSSSSGYVGRTYTGRIALSTELAGNLTLTPQNGAAETGTLVIVDTTRAAAKSRDVSLGTVALTGTYVLGAGTFQVTGSGVVNGTTYAVTVTGTQSLSVTSGGSYTATVNGTAYPGVLNPPVGSGVGAVVTVGTTAGRAACAPNAHVSGRARWTVLVYLNSSNNLNDGDPAINGISDALHNIAQMASVGSDSNVNIVVQWKQANYGDTSQTPTFNATRRYLIKPHSASDITQITSGNTAVLDSDLLPFNSTFYNTTTKQVDMGDWRVLQDFVKWGSTTYPSDNLAVVVWNHGSGWEPVPAQYRAVSLDSQTHNEIETEQIPGALSQAAQPIDALIFDASLMQMAEIEYEVRNSAKVMIGSEESPPGAGYPYDLWISDLKTNNINNGCDLGVSVVNRFVNYYSATDGITQSVIDLSKVQAVATALDNFGGSLINHRADQAPIIRSARNSAQNYKYAEYKDLYNFAELIRTTATAADLQQSAAALQTALTGSNGAVIANGHNQNESGSLGVAITIPSPPNLNLSIAPDFSSYLNLAISQQGAAPRWYQFCVQQVQ